MPTLNWRDREHWNGGRRAACRICGGSTFLRDKGGAPCHKVCAEAEIEAIA